MERRTVEPVDPTTVTPQEAITLGLHKLRNDLQAEADRTRGELAAKAEDMRTGITASLLEFAGIPTTETTDADVIPMPRRRRQ